MVVPGGGWPAARRPTIRERKSATMRISKSSILPSLAAAAALVLAGASPLRASDSTLKDAVTHVKVRVALLEKLGADALHVDVDANGNNVVLSGIVNKKSTEELAKEVALSVEGVRHVDDHITLKAEGNPETPVGNAVGHVESEVKDAILEGRVKGHLLDDVGENAMKIEVEASNGVVSLRGTVSSSSVQKAALQAARSTEGVTKVVDLLRTAS
jgi:osmotically-inducible protein OsmY